MVSMERHFFAYLDEMNIITILLPFSYHQGMSASFTITCDFQSLTLAVLDKSEIENHVKYTCSLSEGISFGKQYWIIDEHGGKTDLQIGAVIRTEAFDEKFYYNGDDLGVKVENNQTRFKLWAPTATQVKVKLHHPHSSFSEIVKMKLEDKGVWSATVHKDLEYYQYAFLVFVNQEWREAVDPYATAVTANGEYGVIVKLEKTFIEKRVLPALENPVDAIIYETHIRDFTIHPHSGVKNKGLFLGAGELNTTGIDGEPTGLSYLKELGITHIEFLPINDFAGVDEMNRNHHYNWGYNPLHFNVPDGSYSSNPADSYSRIIELKFLIDQIHDVGLKVIMDVVYNHVYIREDSSFEKIVPGYYFRHNEFGLPSNGTGVGNDVASERKMVRKYIVDSITFWLKEYHVDGFRFDLMGILDVETMKEIRKTCDCFEKGIILLGEGWNLNTPLPIEKKAIIRNQSKMPGIAQFNDKFRDTIKGNTFNLFDKGYAFGNAHYYEAACEMLAGSIGLNKKEYGIFQEPCQSVNYVECHDNHTMWDKLISCNDQIDDFLRMKYHRLATGMVLLSQGIPFLHSGQEFFRTKMGDGNSYRSPDSINRLDWDRKCQYKDNVKYIKGLIEIRKALSCFRMKSASEVSLKMHSFQIGAPAIGYLYQNHSKDFTEVLLLINPLPSKHTVSLPEGKWVVLSEQKFLGINSKKVITEEELVMEPVSLHILAKK